MYAGPIISGVLHLGLLALAFAPARPDPLAPVDSGPPVEVELLTLNEYNAAISQQPAPPSSDPPDSPDAPEPDVALAPPETPPPEPAPQFQGVTLSAPPEEAPAPEADEVEPPSESVTVASKPPELDLDERALLDRAIQRSDIVPEDSVRVATAPEPPRQPRGVFDAPEIETDPDEPPEPPEPTAEPEPSTDPSTELAEAVEPRNTAPPENAPLPRPKPRGSLAAESTDEEPSVRVAPSVEVGEADSPQGETTDADRARKIAEELIARTRQGVDPAEKTPEELEAERIAREDERIALEDAREADETEERADEELEAERERAAAELAAAREAAKREAELAEQESAKARAELEKREAEARKIADEAERAKAELAALRAAEELKKREEEARQAQVEEERRQLAAEIERQQVAEAARIQQELRRQQELAERAAQEDIRRRQEQAQRAAQAELQRQQQAAYEAEQRRRRLEQFNSSAAPLPNVSNAGVPSPAPADALMSALTGAVGGQSSGFDGRAFSRNVAAAGGAPPLTPGERQRLLAQLQRCWRVDHVSQQARQNVVVLRAQLRQNGFVDRASIQLVAPSRSPATQIAIEKAQNALLDTACQPFNLPPDKYASWQSIEIVFDPKNMVVQ